MVECEDVRGIGVLLCGDKADQRENFYIFTNFIPAVYVPIMKGLFISFGLSTKSPLTFFSASAGAVRKGQAIALTSIASGAAAALCFFSAAGKEKEDNYELKIMSLLLHFKFLHDSTD